MLGFSHYRKQEQVKRLLTHRINQTCVDSLKPGERTSSRSAFCEVVWVIPGATNGRCDISSAVPMVGKDVSPRGLSLIHTAALADESVIVGLQTATGPEFLLCSLEHSTPLGYGFHQIGLRPGEIAKLPDAKVAELQQRMEAFAAAPEPVGT